MTVHVLPYELDIVLVLYAFDQLLNLTITHFHAHTCYFSNTANPTPIHPVGCGVNTEANLWYRRRMEGWPCLWALRTTAPPNLGYPAQPGYQSLPVVAPTPDTPLPPQRFGYKNLKQALKPKKKKESGWFS